MTYIPRDTKRLTNVRASNAELKIDFLIFYAIFIALATWYISLSVSFLNAVVIESRLESVGSNMFFTCPQVTESQVKYFL